jgi:hypothetical protein
MAKKHYAVYMGSTCRSPGCTILQSEEIKDYIQVNDRIFIIIENKGEEYQIRPDFHVHTFTKVEPKAVLDFFDHLGLENALQEIMGFKDTMKECEPLSERLGPQRFNV